MGQRGPTPKPTNIKKLHGTYRADRAPKAEPKPKVEAPTCPSWLHVEAKREWKRIIDKLEKLGLVTELDRAPLAGYCQAYAEWWKMCKEVEKHGEVHTTDKGYPVQRPEVSMRDKAWDRMLKSAREFGFTPSARSRVNAIEQTDNDDDFFGY